jgi:pyroglutamyl-peptidase
MNNKVLITCFDSFSNFKSNSSEKIIKYFPNKLEKYHISKCTIPTKYFDSYNCIKETIQKIKPQFVILMGQAANRKSLCIELSAHNLINSHSPDNNGQIITNQVIDNTKDAKISTSMSIKCIRQNLNNLYIPVRTSYNPGYFVCNFLYFKTISFLQTDFPYSSCIFLHLPLIKKNQEVMFYKEIEKLILMILKKQNN